MKEIAVLECENGKSFQARSLRARSHNYLFIDFLNVSVFSITVFYSAIPYEKIKAYMFLRRSLASLARAYTLHVYDFFFPVHFGACPPPPPHTQELAALLLPAFAHQKSGQTWPIPSPPPPPTPTRYAATGERVYIPPHDIYPYRVGETVSVDTKGEGMVRSIPLQW